MSTKYKVFAGVSPGLEGYLTSELKRIVPTRWREIRGGAEATLDRVGLWTVCRQSRLAELVRVRIGESRALTFWDFVSGIERMPWNAYIKAPAPIPDVSTVCIKSRLWHDKAVSERVVTALVNRQICRFEDAPESIQKFVDLHVRPDAPRDLPGGAGHGVKSNRLLCRPRDQEYVGGQSATGSFKPLMGMGKLVPKKHEKKPVTGDPTQIYVRFEHDLATVSIDAAGPALFKRGYRKMVVGSPIRETLAAACLHAVTRDLGTDGLIDATKPLLHSIPMWDPMCGSGTMVLEAATEAGGFPPAVSGRFFPFEAWPTHDSGAYREAVSALSARRSESTAMMASHTHPAFGSDLNSMAVDCSLANAEEAGVASMWPGGGGGGCEFWTGSAQDPRVSDRVPQGSVVVTNIPYGMRLGGAEAAIKALNRLLTIRPDLHAYALAKHGSLEGTYSENDKCLYCPAAHDLVTGKGGSWQSMDVDSEVRKQGNSCVLM